MEFSFMPKYPIKKLSIDIQESHMNCKKHPGQYQQPEACRACAAEAQGKRFVDMSDWIIGVSPVPCVIVRAETGIIYSQQVGGCYELHQKEIEGYIDEWTPLRAWYADIHRACMEGAPDVLQDMWSTSTPPNELRSNLRASNFDMQLLDTEALDDGEEWGEAWIPVKHPDGRRGILTYPNSD